MNEQAEKYLSTLDRLPNTIKAYRWALSIYFDTVDELSDEAYEKFLVSLKGYSPSTKKIVLSAVMGLYEHCETGDLAKREKLNKHYTRPVKTKPVNFDREGIEKIIEHCDALRNGLMELRDRAFVLTLADSGFRISELSELTRGEIDWKDERVAITGKGEKPAVVRMSERSVKALQDYLQARSKLDGASGKPLGSLPLFAQHGNVGTIKPMTVDGMRKAIKARMKEVGVNVRLHDFRHYFVTIAMIASGGSLKLAQELARHESTVTTNRYAHFAQSELDQSYDQIFNRKV